MEKSIKAYIEEIDLSSEKAYNQLFEIFTKKYPMPVLTVPIVAQSVVHRSRQNRTESNFTEFKDLSYPPREILTEYSRANKPFEQIFYASDDYETNLIELLPYWSSLVEVGGTIVVTIGFWQIDTNCLVGIIPDLANRKLMAFIKTTKFSSEFNRNIEDWDVINQYFRGQGFYDKDIYIVTSAYCKAVLHNIETLGDNAQGVLYTSAQNAEGWNLALNPRFVDDHLHLVRVGKQFIRRNLDANGKPSYDNFQTPVVAKKLDQDNYKIIW
jgi:hypothetical protein